MESVTDGVLILLFLALLITPGKYLGLGGMGVLLFVGFLLSVSGANLRLSSLSWVSWASGFGSLVCIGVWLIRKLETPILPSDPPQPKNHE